MSNLPADDEVRRLIIRGDGSFTVDPKGDWVAARHYDNLLAEIERLDREKDKYALLAAQRQTECARLSERLKWYENYVKACDNEIRRARGVMPTADVPEEARTRVCDCDVGLCSKGSRAPDQYCRIQPPSAGTRRAE